MTQHWVNYLGIYSTIASTVTAILVAMIVDKIKGKNSIKSIKLPLKTFNSLKNLFVTLKNSDNFVSSSKQEDLVCYIIYHTMFLKLEEYFA